jgi:cytochrome c oxidase subunit 1
MTGRLMSEPLGRLHFWLTIVGAYATFLPMHLNGLAGEPRHYAQLSGIPGPGGSLSTAGQLLSSTLPLNRDITYAAIFLITAQLIFFLNLYRSLRRGALSSANPWHATTLEWHPALHPNALPNASDERIAVYCAPCEYHSIDNGGDAFRPQWIAESTVESILGSTEYPKPE